MKRLLALTLFLAFATGAEAQTVYNRLYATETKIDFALWKLDATGLKTDAADGGSDCTVIKDEDAEPNCTNDFVDEGSSYSITLSAAEMTAARVVVHIVDQSSPKVFLDKVLIVETYGQTNLAQHPDGTYKTAQAGGASTITLASSETIATDVPNNSTGITIIRGTGAGQTRLITDYDSGTKVATVGTAWTTQPGSDSVYELVAAPGGTSSLTADDVWAASTRSLTDKAGFSLANDAITASVIAADAIGASEIAANAITSSEFAQGAADLVWGTATRALTDKTGFTAACSLGTDAITAASVSAAAGSKLADIVLRRNTSNVESSSDGDSIDRKSLLGAVSQQTHKVAIVGDTMTIYRSDGTTSLSSRTLTSSSSAAPITGIGN